MGESKSIMLPSVLYANNATAVACSGLSNNVFAGIPAYVHDIRESVMAFNGGSVRATLAAVAAKTCWFTPDDVCRRLKKLIV